MTAFGYVTGDTRKVDVAGDTMTGDLVLAGDPDASLKAATKRYVDNTVSGASATFLDAALNLSDLTNAGTARTSLGLGDAATKSVGTTAGTVAAGDDSRISGALQKASNLVDLTNVATARTNLGLGGAAILSVGTTAGTVAAGDDSRLSDTRTPTDNSVTSAKIADGAIVNADINGSAAITLSKLATDPLARANHTGTQIASTISGFDTQVRTSRLDQMAAPTGALSLNSQKITSLLDPTAAQDASSKAYTDGLIGATPEDLGLKAFAYDPASVSTSQAITSGTIYVCGIYVRKAITVTQLAYVQSVAGTGPVAGQSWIGLYTAAGSKLADAALDSVLTSAGVKAVTISSQNLTAGLYWVAILQNATSQQGGTQNSVGGSQIFAALGLTSGATSRYAVNGTGATTLPSSITPASNTTAGAKYFWVAVN